MSLWRSAVQTEACVSRCALPAVIFATLLIATPLRAASSPAALPAGQGIIVRMPHTPGGAIDAMLELEGQRHGGSLGPAVTVDSADPRLIDALRLELLTVRARQSSAPSISCPSSTLASAPSSTATPEPAPKHTPDQGSAAPHASTAAVHPPGETPTQAPTQAPTLATLLDQAAEALDFVELGQAARLLDHGRVSLQCELEPATTAQLSRYFFLRGVLEIYQGREDSAFFGDAVAVDPGFPYPSSYPVRVEKPFVWARARREQAPRAQVHFPDLDLAGLELRVDGRRPASGAERLWPGRHLLQLLDPAGQVKAATIVDLEPGEDTIWPPPPIRPPDQAAVTTLLTGALREGLEPQVAQAIDRLLLAQGRSWLALVGSGAAGSARVLFLERGSRPHLEVVSPSDDVSFAGRADLGAPPASRIRLGKIVTASLGAVTVAATGWYVGYYAYGESRPFTQDDAEQVVGRASFGRTLALVGLAATAVSAGVTFLPAKVHARRVAESGPALRVAVGPGRFDLFMGVEW